MLKVLTRARVAVHFASHTKLPGSSLQRFMSDGSNSDSEQAAAGRFKVYTRTGDAGTSSLYTGERRPKTDDIFMALGDTDELNAFIGVAREHCTGAGNGLDAELAEIQSRLLDVGSAIATPVTSKSSTKIARVAFSEHHADDLETKIDAMDEELPPLKNFILPSGGLSSAHLHVARTVCRRAERRVTALVATETVDSSVSKYLNRLSDYLFVAARFAAMKDGKPEVIYQKSREPPLAVKSAD